MAKYKMPVKKFTSSFTKIQRQKDLRSAAVKRQAT